MTSIHASAAVHAGAQLGEGVEIGPYCVVGANVKLGAGTRLLSHVVLDGCTTIGGGSTVFPFACLGTQTQDLKYKGGKTYVEIGDSTTIREYVTVNCGTAEGEVTRVGSHCHIMAYCHVAHGCQVGDGVIMANGASLAGETIIEDQAVLGGMSGFHQFVRVGRMCMVGGMSRITQDCPPYMIVEGNPPAVYGLNSVKLERTQMAADTRKSLKDCYRILYREGLSTRQALERIRAEIPTSVEVAYLVAFFEAPSRQGVLKK
jgi:UDP-N-acetylglucosamine acyltransferase